MTRNQKINALKKLSLPELQAAYAKATGRPGNSGDRDGMVRLLSARLTASGKAPAATPATDAKPSGKARRAPAKEGAAAQGSPFTRDDRLPPVGSTITKVWRDKTLKVEVRADGFGFNGKTYRSLSAIACELLKGSVNGFLFFGLTGRRAAKPATEKASTPAAKAKAAPKGKKAPRAKSSKAAAKKS